MLDLAASLWLGALLVTSALFALVVLAQSAARQLRRFAGSRPARPAVARTQVEQASSREPMRARERLTA